MIGFAEVAALVTVMGAAIYGLGLLGVAWSLHKRWNNDASTTWYALSLMPRMLVAGQGMRILIGFPTIMATLLLLWWLLVFPTVRLLSAAVSNLAAVAVNIFALVALGAGIYWLMRSKYRQRIQWLLGPNPEFPRYRWLIWITVGLAIPTYYVAGRLAAGAMEVQGEFPFITVDSDLLLIAITLTFLASFLLQLIDATAISPPLPTVEIAMSDAAQTVLEGKLLTHFEGVVYFFDEQRRLTSMPDSKITSVRVRKEQAYVVRERETAEWIPNARLVLYENRVHGATFAARRFGRDVVPFLKTEHPALR